MDTFRKIGRIIVPVAMAALPLLVLAALPQPTNPIGGSALSLDEIQDLIEKVARFLIIVSIVIAVIFIIWGAIVWMSAGGNDDRVKKGKAYVFNGILGAGIVFAIGVILQTLAGLITRTFFS